MAVHLKRKHSILLTESPVSPASASLKNAQSSMFCNSTQAAVNSNASPQLFKSKIEVSINLTEESKHNRGNSWISTM